jgi:threonylcarbamoyladenosine tRNA methylthiotransferase MtaB
VTTFAIQNFGCRATQADAAAIESNLLATGATPASSLSSADVVILNTCTVTQAADSQARDAIRHIHRANSQARIVVTGCYAQRAPHELVSLDGVSWVVGNSRQGDIPSLLNEPLNHAPTTTTSSGQIGADFVPLDALGGEPELNLARRKILVDDPAAWPLDFSQQAATTPTTPMDRTRPVLKIQDGCNNRCSYCIIPSVRGASRSLAPGTVISAIRQLAASGAREVVLSGINLGSYGRDLAPRASLLDLLPKIISETPIESARLSSIEPMDATEDFVRLLSGSPRFAPHFHMPLQSASDPILRAMRRWYRAAHYQRRIELIREFLPHAAIGADVIVGFPGETEAQFNETLHFIESLPFSYLHIFSFSPRPGTPAASLFPQIPPSLIHQRASALRILSTQKEAQFRASQAGRTLRALTLHKRHAHTPTSTAGSVPWTPALTGNFLKIQIEGNYPANQWIDVTLPNTGELAKPLAAG